MSSSHVKIKVGAVVCNKVIMTFIIAVDKVFY